MNRTMPSDHSELERSVEREIDQRTWGGVHQLQVELSEGRLIVRGCTSSYYLKQLAIQAAFKALGEEHSIPLVLEIQVGTDRPRPIQGQE